MNWNFDMEQSGEEGAGDVCELVFLNSRILRIRIFESISFRKSPTLGFFRKEFQGIP